MTHFTPHAHFAHNVEIYRARMAKNVAIFHRSSRMMLRYRSKQKSLYERVWEGEGGSLNFEES